MSEYVEVEDPRELKRLAGALRARIKARLTLCEIREIGDPSGSYRRRVCFEPGMSTDALYWSGGPSSEGRVASNLFGVGAPGASAQLYIWLQFNLPVATFSRRFGGAFLRHLPTNRIVLAHRGIVTLGHSRVKRAVVFREMHATIREAETSKGAQDFLLIGELDSSTLTEDVKQFASELRRVVRRRDIDELLPKDPSNKPRGVPRESFGKLRDYFEEFHGERMIKSRSQTVADCYHGTIIRALRAAFQNARQVLKNREVDLTVITSERAYLFEAKTSTASQHIYTAIGQLAAHTPAVVKHARPLPVTRVIVLPGKPSKRYRQLLTRNLGICIVTFKRSAKGRITLEGLDALP